MALAAFGLFVSLVFPAAAACAAHLVERFEARRRGCILDAPPLCASEPFPFTAATLLAVPAFVAAGSAASLAATVAGTPVVPVAHSINRQDSPLNGKLPRRAVVWQAANTGVLTFLFSFAVLLHGRLPCRLNQSSDTEFWLATH